MSQEITIRGDEARESFAREHEITCVGHLILRPGKTQNCCCGRKDITSEYYIFSCHHREQKNDEVIIFAGPDCGRKLAEKANVHIPPIVSAFSNDSIVTDGKKRECSHGTGESSFKFSPLNKEMYHALSVLFTEWQEITPGYLCNGFKFIINNPNCDIFPSYVRAINRAIRTAWQKKLGKNQEYFPSR